MSAYLTGAIVWGPSIYYSCKGIATNLFATGCLKLSNLPSIPARVVYPDVFDKVKKLRDDILLVEAPKLLFTALGTNFGPTPIILIDEDFDNVDVHAMGFMIKHEFSHINSSDNLMNSSLAGIAAAITALGVPYLYSCLPSWIAPLVYLLPFLVSLNVHQATNMICEAKADKFAILHCTDKELIGCERFILAQIEVGKLMHKKYPQIFTAEGNLSEKNADTHLPETVRLEKIRKELKKRNLTFQTTVDIDPEQMNKLQNYLKAAYAKHLKLKVD